MNYSIFFYDDEDGPAYALSCALEDAGFKVFRVDRVGNYSVDNLTSYDALILDISGLDRCEGLTFAEAIRTAGVNIPIVFSSATSFNTDENLRKRLNSISNKVVLQRPHSNKELIYEIKRLINLKRMTNEQERD